MKIYYQKRLYQRPNYIVFHLVDSNILKFVSKNKFSRGISENWIKTAGFFEKSNKMIKIYDEGADPFYMGLKTSQKDFPFEQTVIVL